eukprot:jgi/Botrbrau1/2009/Bobra.0052s0049.1
MNNRKLDVSKAQNERHKQILQALLKQEENRRCADCLARGPTWASVNLGLFVCLNCSGHHRSLGVHISKVRSATLDTWLPEQVDFVQQMGNRRANEYWEACLPKDFRRPSEGDMTALAVFIGDKYRNQAYAAQEFREAPTIENFREHPFMARGAGLATPQANGAAQESSSASAAAIRTADSPAAVSSLPATSRNNAGPTLKPEPNPHLFDLLQLDEPKQGVAAAQPPVAASTGVEGGWAAWDTTEGTQGIAKPSSMTPQPNQANSLAAVTGLADEWDAFQSSTAVLDGPTPRSSDDPFASSGGLADDPFAAVSGGGFAAFPEVAPTPAKQGLPGPAKKSHDDILKMFDTPQSGPGMDPLLGYIPAVPAPTGLPPMFRPQGLENMGHQAPLGFPPPQMGTPANFAGLQLHGVSLAGSSPLRDPYSAIPLQNMAPNSAVRPGSFF